MGLIVTDGEMVMICSSRIHVAASSIEGVPVWLWWMVDGYGTAVNEP